MNINSHFGFISLQGVGGEGGIKGKIEPGLQGLLQVVHNINCVLGNSLNITNFEMQRLIDTWAWAPTEHRASKIALVTGRYSVYIQLSPPPNNHPVFENEARVLSEQLLQWRARHGGHDRDEDDGSGAERSRRGEFARSRGRLRRLQGGLTLELEIDLFDQRQK